QLAAQGKAIVVTIAYRLNVFGFLATEAMARAGHANAGLQDQQMALRWVAEQIGAFGGDPAQVTVFGESAGGGSVLMQLLAPQSQGLFRRAVLQSAWQWRLPTLDEAQGAADALARAQGCGGPAAERLACLQGKPAQALLPA